MKNRLYLLLIMLSLCAARMYAQSSTSSWTEVNGVAVTFWTKGETGTSTSSNGKRVERALINNSTGIFVGYSLTVEQLGDSTKLKVTISPLPETAIERLREKDWMKDFQRRWPNRTSFEPSPLPRFPEPQVIDVTEVIKLPLWINPETGAQMGDEIHFELQKLKPVRDFDLDGVKLRLSNHRLKINGEERSGSHAWRDISGPLPFFSVPGKGRFIFSLFPREGYDFQKIGVIDNNKIIFSYEGDNYEWVSHDPVFERFDKWYLWVMHDESYQTSREALDAFNAKVDSKNEGNCCIYGALADKSMLPGANK
ncbi:MAG: hypothetical protein J2P41_02565 [Blastocatellia bacterium]|nr:hypothetical protein [Blastocatellia bacterium]